ncbi:hypothetical protein CYMTET_19170, partial [Cymbomonas tetramitiformis]
NTESENELSVLESLTIDKPTLLKSPDSVNLSKSSDSVTLSKITTQSDTWSVSSSTTRSPVAIDGVPFRQTAFREADYKNVWGEWCNFKRVDDPGSLRVQVSDDIHRKTLLLWESWGWIGWEDVSKGHALRNGTGTGTFAAARKAEAAATELRLQVVEREAALVERQSSLTAEAERSRAIASEATSAQLEAQKLRLAMALKDEESRLGEESLSSEISKLTKATAMRTSTSQRQREEFSKLWTKSSERPSSSSSSSSASSSRCRSLPHSTERWVAQAMRAVTAPEADSDTRSTASSCMSIDGPGQPGDSKETASSRSRSRSRSPSLCSEREVDATESQPNDSGPLPGGRKGGPLRTLDINTMQGAGAKVPREVGKMHREAPKRALSASVSRGDHRPVDVPSWMQ